MLSAFNLLVFHFLYERAMCSLEKWHIEITIIIIIVKVSFLLQFLILETAKKGNYVLVEKKHFNVLMPSVLH